jgi:hypothetical protein
MDLESRNQEIRKLLDLWQWCSRTLHVQWERKRKYRNGCLFGLASAINESQFGANVSPYQLPLVYRDLAEPLFNDLGLLAFWEEYPTPLLDMCLGCFTKGSPLSDRLNRLRLKRQDNPAFDKLFKKMRGREERYGWDWSAEGHHPEGEFVQLKKEMTPLCDALKKVIVEDCAAVEILGREILSQGPWELGSLPASSFVRKTPESLLNRALRLKLWRVAKDVLSKHLEDDARLQALCSGFYGAITPSVEAAIESQGHTVDDVVDDFLNYDMRKTRKEITNSLRP